jgi:hypothetical protein
LVYFTTLLVSLLNNVESKEWPMNGALEMIWKEAAVEQLSEQSWHQPGGSEEYHR